MFKKILLACMVLTSTQQTVQAHTPVAHIGFKGLVKESVQYAAGGVALTSLVYGTYELSQAIKHWIQTNNDNPYDTHKDERNQSALRMLAALALAATSGVICYADLNAVVVHIDLGPIFAAIINNAFRR